MARQLYDQVAVAVDGSLYCLDCAPMDAEQAEEFGIGGPVFENDVADDDVCDDCGSALEV